MIKKLFLILLVSVYIVACATVPYTRRKSLMLISLDTEIALGERTFKEILKNSKLIQDTPEAELIKKVGQRIAMTVNRPEYKWEFVLIDDTATINAFCLPGGKIAFYSGILPLCQSEEGIAVVMGHEVAHAVARHGAERMSKMKLVNIIGEILSFALTGRTTPIAKKAILQAYGLGAMVGIVLPYSRKHEYEADYLGAIFMAKAGYDPNEAINFWKKMVELTKDKKKIPDFLSTHPADEKRISRLKKSLPEVMKYYKTD